MSLGDIFDEHDARNNPLEALKGLNVQVSPDFDAYASGEIDLSQVRCVLCTKTPCECPEFGTPEFYALLDQRRANRREGGAAQ